MRRAARPRAYALSCGMSHVYVVRDGKVTNKLKTTKTREVNKYHQLLAKILKTGRRQTNKKGDIIYLLNERLSLTPGDLLEIFEGHSVARKKLKAELSLYMAGECDIERYREAGIT